MLQRVETRCCFPQAGPYTIIFHTVSYAHIVPQLQTTRDLVCFSLASIRLRIVDSQFESVQANMSEIEATEIERALFRLKAPPRLAVHDADIKVYLGSKHIPLEKVRQIVEQRQLIPSLRKQEIPTAWLFAQLPDRSRSDTLPLTDWDLEVALQGAEHHESATYLFELCSERASDLMDADRLVLIQRLQGVWSVVSSRLSIEAIRSSEKAVHLARGPNGVVAHLDSSVFDFGQFVRDCALSAGLSVSLADTFRIVFIEELFAAEIELIGFTRQDSSDPDRISFQTLRSVSDEEEGETDVAVA